MDSQIDPKYFSRRPSSFREAVKHGRSPTPLGHHIGCRCGWIQPSGRNDERTTITVLKARRQDVLEPLVAQYHGRIFKVMGDGVLIEFASPVNDVQCAVALQRGMATANDGLPADRQIVLRSALTS